MYLDNSIIVAKWPRQGPAATNWGDKLNPELISQLALSPVVHERDVTAWEDRPVYRVIGSALSKVKANEICWGMGFISHNDTIAGRPAMVCAVRGPRSREKLIQQDQACPEVYGDPAILYCLIYWPTIEKKYDVGVIQHVREVGKIDIPSFPAGQSVLPIDISGGINEVVDQILSCRMIVSSSLHGIICSHTYNVPAYWWKASDLPLGDDFKFHDYYASIGHDTVEPARVSQGVFDPGRCPDQPGTSRISIRKLLTSCPFLTPRRKRELMKHHAHLAKSGRKSRVFAESVAAGA